MPSRMLFAFLRFGCSRNISVKFLNIKKMMSKGEDFHVEFKGSVLWSLNYTPQQINESKSFELKEYGQRASKVIIAKSIASFLNSDGGNIVIGIKENNRFEVNGVNEAINYVRETNEHISIELIKEIHKIIFKNSKGFAGELRKPGEEVVVKNRFGEILHEGAPQSRIFFLLKELATENCMSYSPICMQFSVWKTAFQSATSNAVIHIWYNNHKNKYPALILAAVTHDQFENIHPFRDGNDRVGRILLNNILIKNNLPPINIDLKNRLEYYESL